MPWSTSELRVRLAPLNRFKPSSKIFYWPFQGGTSFVDLLCFCSVLCLLCFVHVCLYVLCGHLLGKGWPLGSRLWCLLCVCHFPIGILGQVWYLIVSIPDLCTITYLNYAIITSTYAYFIALTYVRSLWRCSNSQPSGLLFKQLPQNQANVNAFKINLWCLHFLYLDQYIFQRVLSFLLLCQCITKRPC